MKTMVLAGAVALGLSTGAAFASTSPSGDVSTDATPARISHTVAGAGSVLAVGPRVWAARAPRVPPPSHPARPKPPRVGGGPKSPAPTTMPGTIIPRQCEKCMPASGIQTTRQFNSIGTVPAARRPYVRRVAPSWSNPTGQVEHGPNGTISLFAPTDNGN